MANGKPGFGAGTGVAGVSGDGGLATASRLSSPEGVAIDKTGSVYIAETNNHKIRKVDATGTLSTFAGVGGAQNFSGDGGPANQASLAFPQSIAFDPLGNLYICDTGNSRVRKVDTGGFIATVAGNGVFGFAGDGGLAIVSTLNRPSSAVADGAGNVYIADRNNSRLRQIDPTGTINTLVVNAVAGLAFDASGNLYLADGSSRVFRVNGTAAMTPIAGNDTVTFAGDGGPALNVSLNAPFNIVFDATGNLLISDSNNYRLRRVSTAGTITTIAGNGNYKFTGDGGPATNANLNAPGGVAVDQSGNIYVVDSGNHRIRRIGPNGVITTVAGNGVPGFSGDGFSATVASLNNPRAVAVDPSGNLLIGDANNRRIRKVGTNGIISTFAGDGGLSFAGDGLPAVFSPINTPSSVAVDVAGNVYIADSGNNRVLKVDGTGTMTTLAGNGNKDYTGDGGPANGGALNAPLGVTVDSSGDVYVADTSNNVVRKISQGIITTFAGGGIVGFTADGIPAVSAALSGPRALAVDSSGNVYIADAGNERIRKVTIATGLISTVGGKGSAGLTGDGELAVLGSMNTPEGVAVDSNGNVYFADTSNDRIRKIGP
jgi:trimeric autotransporter adhesin